LAFPINDHLQDVILLETPNNLQETLFKMGREVFVPSSSVLIKVSKGGISLTCSSFEGIGVNV
jgi:hypothetical protein